MSLNPIGEFFKAIDGGMSSPLDRTAFDRIQAQAAAGTGEQMEVTGLVTGMGRSAGSECSGLSG